MSQTSRGQAGGLASLREQVPGQQETLDFWASLVLLKGLFFPSAISCISAFYS